MKKIPPDAFDFYFSLGPPRSYQAVADKYGVTKRAVTALLLEGVQRVALVLRPLLSKGRLAQDNNAIAGLLDARVYRR